jgi:4-amino-4-deoxy-L-arabinose transferase-like glycosyltransferase
MPVRGKAPVLSVRSAALRWWPAWLLVAGGVLALGTRFVERDLGSYVLDEPLLQDSAVRDARTGRWADISVLRGTRGVRYGPAPLWFYTAVHRVAGPRPEAGIVGAGLFLTAAVVLLSIALARRSEAPPLVLGVALWLAAASPFAFLWSRQGWDNPLLAGFVALTVAVLARAGAVRPPAAALTGVLLGLGMATHLMAAPFVVAVLWVLLSERRGWRERLLVLGALVVAAALVLLPYLRALLHEPSASAPVAPVLALDHVGRALQALVEPFAQSAGTGLGYFLDVDAPRFSAETAAGRALPLVAPVVTVVVAAGTLLGLLRGRRAASPGIRRVARLGLWTWVLHAAFLGLLALPAEPHYQQPVLWVPAAGWAIAVATLWPLRPRASQVLAGLALALGLWGIWVQRSLMGWIHSSGGTRGIHYGLTIGAQREALAEACAAPTPGVALQTLVVVFPQSLRSLAHTEPACRNHRVEVCGLACPPVPPGWTVKTVRYAGPGALLAPVQP